MKSWIIFSIGVSRHFCIYSTTGVDTCRMIIESLDSVDEIISRLDCEHIVFLARYETEYEFYCQRQPDIIVDQLRERYRRPGAHEV